MSANEPVAYVGVGIMGAAMARNLLRAGVPVVACNRSRAKAEALTADGAQVVDTAAEAVTAGCRVVFVNVPDTPDVDAVLFGEGGVIAADSELLKGLIVVDHSTICPVATAGFAQRLAEVGATLVDAPVSGGDVGARDGTLSIMCGGDRAAFDKVQPLLQKVGKRITHLGPAGSGQACKACNQIAVVGALAGVCEALALAKATGLDLEQVVEVVSAGAAGSWQLANLGPQIAAGDHAPGFMIELLQKDLRLVASAAGAHDLPLPVTRLVESLYQAAAAAGAGRDGTQALAGVYERLGGFRYSE
ncbi:2-hydroxy-3-oxopropionate reductase [Botrimarina colliarenosi]|uniref:2-hydroxy-3-oxopropionate reductase n=1 Tax=Botrimarina colliarenosi TaxID=2528001 RepID=A0A5C6A2H6_9BACT|nr:NAD(P)-dependent oxidoreductase [Botrimarina colliarenosi]TWT94072.1 2-hydroxy-3-oxopropionate reductase [Botrimarina colliarenosi]